MIHKLYLKLFKKKKQLTPNRHSPQQVLFILHKQISFLERKMLNLSTAPSINDISELAESRNYTAFLFIWLLVPILYVLFKTLM